MTTIDQILKEANIDFEHYERMTVDEEDVVNVVYLTINKCYNILCENYSPGDNITLSEIAVCFEKLKRGD